MKSTDGERKGLGSSNFQGAEAALRRAAHVARRRAEEVSANTGRPLTSGPMGSLHGIGVDPRKLSFSQAQGYEKLPEPLRLGELSKEARVQIWNVVYLQLARSIRSKRSAWGTNYYYMINPWMSILQRVHSVYEGQRVDEYDNGFESVCGSMRYRIETEEFNKVFDLIRFIMRDPECPEGFVEDMRAAFKRSRLAYAIDSGPPPTIIPAVTTEEGEAVAASLQTLDDAGLQGSASHLRKSAECINREAWADSIRESIHAVESVARQLNPRAATLAPALKSLEAQGALHPALKSAFSKLYGYTSDEQGIRHAHLNADQANVGMDEAVFMLGACASFASYLWRKHSAGSAS